MWSSLEKLLTDPDGLRLTTATPVQRAVCRIIDGAPLRELAADPNVQRAVGGPDALAMLPPGQPRSLLLVAGIRCAKSMIVAAACIRYALTCPLDHLSPGDVPRAHIVSTSLDVARQTWNHVLGAVTNSAAIRGRLIGEPTASSMRLRHESGRPVEIRITAGARAGGSLVGGWLACVVFDEAPRMVGRDAGTVNLDDALQAVSGRMLGPILMSGAPWAPFGPVYKMVNAHHGKPTRDLVVVRSRAYEMNPVIWTPERVEQQRIANFDTFKSDVEVEFSASETSMFSAAVVEACARKAPDVLPPDPSRHYVAAMDPATRGNAWTLVVATSDGMLGALPRLQVALARQWLGSRAAPLRPDDVLGEMAPILRAYRIDTVVTDQWATDAIRDLAERHGFYVREVADTQAGKVEAFGRLHTMATMGALELPPDRVLINDLLTVRKRVTQQGFAIHMPETPDGRHADFASALARTAMLPIEQPEQREPEGETPTERAARHWQASLDERIERENAVLREEETRELWDMQRERDLI